MRDGREPGHRQGLAEQEIFILRRRRRQPFPFLLPREIEFRGMERTVVIRATSSTFSLREVGSESAIVGVACLKKERRRRTYRRSYPAPREYAIYCVS